MEYSQVGINSSAAHQAYKIKIFCILYNLPRHGSDSLIGRLSYLHTDHIPQIIERISFAQMHLTNEGSFH